jgi:hypothetical protein
MNHKPLLKRLCACREAVKWYDRQDSYRAWRSCKRGDWLLWIAAKLKINSKLIVLASCDCAELSLKFVPDGENRPRKAIETARAWCDGNATLAQVRVAAAAAAYAAAADAAAAAAYAAAAAAYAAADAAYADAAAAYAAADAAASVADAAASVAYAAATANAYAAYATDADTTTKQKWLAKCAVLVRKRIPWPIVRDKLDAT